MPCRHSLGAALVGEHLCIMAVLTSGGCASSALSLQNFGVRRVQSADAAALLRKAENVLKQAGFQIDKSDRRAGVLETKPRAVSPEEAHRAPWRTAGSQPPMRRVARVQVERSGDVISVYCRVVWQEQSTETHRMFQHDRELSDLPDDTPIEREGATTTEQNTVWRTVRRDKPAERRILDTIVE